MKWLADECLDNDIVRGLLRASPGLDLLRVQDVAKIAGCDDDRLLEWATEDERVLLTHDLATMIPAILRQLQNAARCTPVVLVPNSQPIGTVIEEILLLDLYSEESDWAAGVIYLPLR